MTILKRFTKAPSEKLYYDFDFAPWLAKFGDSIDTFTVGADNGIDVLDARITGDVVRVLIGGGTSGYAYTIAVDIQTNSVPPGDKRGEIQIRVQGLMTDRVLTEDTFL